MTLEQNIFKKFIKILPAKVMQNTSARINKVITEIEKQGKTVSLGAYWNVVNRANAELFEEVLKMRSPTFKQM